MTRLHVELASQFRDETVVLLSMDENGLQAFRAAVAEVVSAAQPSASCSDDVGMNHVIVLEDDKADVDRSAGSTTWRFSRSKLDEIVRKLGALQAAGIPSHHYVDIANPAKTLVLSYSEGY